ncbi:DUF3261 domain-containing protein [Solimonas sp. K1W22B-7]|uniref:DUF3261 domain-containing protein n=1 Tax=Solimonas sp. K1W22B-7 TaxID=2303331 RepID=UPI000E335DD2|nr:DUF3261 domain-containing protein [Solimonas sp. K1W22B-7]AXQ29290.1 DUF3261 domain-containing protein [Solimonas sp. K1W22B-7]
MRCLSLLLALLLASCAALRPAPPPTPQELPPLWLSPAAFGSSVQLAQRLLVEAGGTRHGLDALLEIDPQQVQLAGLVGGRRVVTLRYDGGTPTVDRIAGLPAVIDEHRVLRDLQLTYWPAEAVRGALPAGWTLAEEPGARRLYREGQVTIEIRYGGQPRWLGHTEFDNLQQHYRLLIDSVSAE